MALYLEFFFITLGLALVISSYIMYGHFTHMPNVRPPKRLSVKAFDTTQFNLERDSSTGLLRVSPCPPFHPLYEQALKVLYDMPKLTYNQVRYLRDLQYTFELAMSAYILSCYNEETIRLAAKFMEDMYLLASEMYAISRRLNLGMQVRFPRECDDPILASNQIRTTILKKPNISNKSRKQIPFKSASKVEDLFDFKGELINKSI